MSNAPPGRKQVHSFADLARLALSKGIASAKARPGPEDLDHYERLCNELLARLGALYPLEPWKVKIWRRKRLLRKGYSEIHQYLREQGVRVGRTRARHVVDDMDKFITEQLRREG